MADQKLSSREKILAAASELARDTGPGHLSLDAVASRAGVSKGGLLYNFPTKAKLMQALVGEYIADFEADLDAATKDGSGENLLLAYLRLSMEECCSTHPSASGVLAAMAEDPDFLLPIRAFKRRLLDRLKEETDDVAGLLTSYLVMEGLRSMKMFDMDTLTETERDIVLASVFASAGGARPA